MIASIPVVKLISLTQKKSQACVSYRCWLGFSRCGASDSHFE